MAHASASGFPGMAENLNGDLGQSSHSDFSQALHSNNAGHSMSSIYSNDIQRSLSSSLQQADFGMNGVSGLGSIQQNWHAQQANMQPSGTDYDAFLANNGLGVKSQRPQPMPGMPPLSRGSSGMDLLAAAQQNGTAQQRHSQNIQQMFANMTRTPNNGQLAALKPYLPPGLSDEQSFSCDLQAGVPTAALLPQAVDAAAQPPPRSDNRIPPVAAAGNGADWPPGNGSHLASHSSGLMSNAYSGAANLAHADIQHLLHSMGNNPAAMLAPMPRPASRASNAGAGPPSRHASGGSLSEMLAAQPKGSPGGASAAAAGSSPPDGSGADAQPPPKSEPGAQDGGAPAAASATGEAKPGTGISAFAAVANVALDDGAGKEEGAEAQSPASTVSTMAGQAALAPNLFDPSYAVPAGNNALTSHLMDPASLAASGAPVRELPPGLSGLDMNMMQQLQQQLGGNASYNDIMEAMRLNAQQQALAQQRVQAARAGSGQIPGIPAAGGMAGLGAYTNQDLLKQADRAGILGRNAMLQQLSKGQVPQQQQVPGRPMAPQAGGLPYGVSDQRVPGVDPYGTATPKPQPSPQQMRFGGNIGVHAINRTSAPQLPGQPQVQNRALLGGHALGLNNPLTAGLAGTVGGAPRPGIKPNWPVQRVQTHAQAAAQAAQAAQVQQVQAMRLAAVKAQQAQAQLNAQLQAQVQAQAQAQAQRTNLLAGLTPAQLNMLMNAPPQQLNQMAAQLGLLDPSPGVGGLSGVPGAGLAGLGGMTQQQKLMAAAAAARTGYAQQAPQRQTPRPMFSQQQLQQLYAQQAAQQGRVTPTMMTNPALAGMGAQPPGGGQTNLGQPGGGGGPANTRAALVDMGRGLAQAGFTVEQAVNSGLLGGFSAFDVRALSEGHQAEVVRMRAARAAAAQNAQANAQQQLAQQHLLRQSQLQQLQAAQQAQAGQAAAANASRAGSDAGSHGGATPKTPAPIMNLGPGSLGQLFDWQPNQGAAASQAGSDLLSGNWDLTSTQLQGGQSGPLGPALSLGGISGPLVASLGLGPIAPRPGSDAGGSDAMFPPSLRSRSPWEGAAPGAGLGVIQPGSARSGVSSHATTPRSRPGTMSSLLDMGNAFGPPAAATVKYASQGSLDGELPSHMRSAPGAQAPIGDGRASKSGQGEVPASLRAFWESGGISGAAEGRPLSKSISLDSARPPAGAQGLPAAGNAMEPAMDLEALDAALEAAANAANAAAEPSGPRESVAPADLDAFTAASYSFFNMQSPMESSAEALGTLSLEGELEGEADKDKTELNGGLDDTGMTEVPEAFSKSAT